jgi:soluble lytic murein transglycosylase
MRAVILFIRLVAAAAGLALLGNSLAQAADPVAANAAVRKSFQEAYAHVAANLEDNGASDNESLKNYPLYPYLLAARIQQALTSTDSAALAQADKRAADFIAAYGQQPVTRNLRRAWLDSLARREQWNQFLAVYRDAGASEASRCESFTARIELQKTEGLATEIGKFWLTPHSLPECDRPFAWLKDNGGLTPALIEERAHLALDNNNPAFARQIIEQLPADRAAPLFQWAGLLESPRLSIDSLIDSPGTVVSPTALLAGWKRLTRVDREAAQERYTKLVSARGLNQDSASPFALALALALAWDRDPEALRYFDQVESSDLDDPAREWWTRAALWSKDWKLAAHVIATLSETDRQSARWRYWLARTTEETHDLKEAQSLYEAVLPDDNYYSAMAAAHLGRPLLPHPEAVPENKQTLTGLEHDPAFERAHELLLCGMRPEAQAEWQYGYEPLNADARAQSIRLAANWGWYDQAVTVASSLHIFNDYSLLYPRPYDAQVNAAAHLAQITPEIVYGVVRQESLYRLDAVSNAGARGLMQLELGTARSTAHYYKRPIPALTDLFDPYINTVLGAARLRMLLDEFDGQTPVALAGYNAGPNAAMRWLPQEAIDSDIWIENIPYNETRGYVQRILWHTLMFTWLRTRGQALHTNTWLTPILPMHHTEQSDRVAASDRLTAEPKGASSRQR